MMIKNRLGYFRLLATLLFLPRKERPIFNGKLILGHRGDRSHAAENTMTSLERAMEHGADGVEFDVFLSSDEIPVIIHDETLERTTDGRGYVWDRTAQELGKLNAAILMPQQNIEGVPTLEQALASFPRGSIINIEAKSGGRFSSHLLVDKIIALSKVHEHRLKIIISSFDGEIVERVRATSPSSRIGFLISDRDEHWPTSLRHFRKTAPDALHIPPNFATTELLWLAKRARISVLVWTINNPELARDLFSKGVVGIFTDRVKEMVEKLRG